MKLGTSLRFVFPTSPKTHLIFQEMLRTAPNGTFIERPFGAYETDVQARNLIEIASAARAAELDGLLVGDSHAASPSYANVFQPIPTLARLLAVTGDMPIGVVLLAPFYHPTLLAEQIGTLAAFTKAPFIVTLALGARPRQFKAFGMEEKSRVGRLEEMVPVVRRLLMGEAVSFKGRYCTLDDAQISPVPVRPVSIWLAGTVRAAAERAGRLGDGWLTAQNASCEQLSEQLDVYQEAAVRAGRAPLPVLRRDIHVGESDAEAQAATDSILSEGYRGAGREVLLIGGPDTIVQRLREYRAMGFSNVMVRHIVGDHQLMLESFRRLGEKVLPRIRDL